MLLNDIPRNTVSVRKRKILILESIYGSVQRKTYY